jgi:hypothetical protein
MAATIFVLGGVECSATDPEVLVIRRDMAWASNLSNDWREKQTGYPANATTAKLMTEFLDEFDFFKDHAVQEVRCHPPRSCSSLAA